MTDKASNHFPLWTVPNTPSLLNNYGYLRKGCKAPLAHKLWIHAQPPSPLDVTIIEASQLLSLIVWPSTGDASYIVKSINIRLSSLPGKKVLVLDRCHSVSAKDHECMWRAGLFSFNYDLTNNTSLPSWNDIMKNKHNKMQLSNVLSTYSFRKEVSVESTSKGVFNHEEADITKISYPLKTP